MTDAQLEQELPETTETDVEVAEEVESSTAEQEVQAEDSSPEEPKGFQKRINEITREKYDAIREVERLKQELAKRDSKPVADEPAKSLADFDYDEAKFAQYVVDTATAKAMEKFQSQTTEKQTEQVRQHMERQFRAQEKAFADATPDYYDLAWSNPMVSDAMAEAIMQMESGPEVAYYLAKNQDASEKLMRLSPVTAAVELGRISERLAAQRSAKGKSVTDAPEPPPKLKPANAAAQKDPSKMTDSEFAKWRRAQIARR